MPGYKKTNLDLENPPNWLTFLKDKIGLSALGLTVTDFQLVKDIPSCINIKSKKKFIW